MVSGTIKADAREALEALNANISHVFALYLAGRQGRRPKGAKAICNKFLKFKGRELTLADCIRFTDTHPVLKEQDPMTVAVKEAVALLDTRGYPFADRVAVAGLALVGRSRQFAQALLTEVKRLQAHDDRMQTTIIGIPMLVAKRLGTLEAGAVTPERRLGGGARKAPNYDRGSSQHGRARWQHVWPPVARKACDLRARCQVGRSHELSQTDCQPLRANLSCLGLVHSRDR